MILNTELWAATTDPSELTERGELSAITVRFKTEVQRGVIAVVFSKPSLSDSRTSTPLTMSC